MPRPLLNLLSPYGTTFINKAEVLTHKRGGGADGRDLCAHGIPHTYIFFKIFRGEQSYQEISNSGRSIIAGGGPLSARSGPLRISQ